MNRTLYAAAVWVFLLISCELSRGEPVEAFDFESIVSSSDLIAVAQPLDTTGKVQVLAVFQGTGVSAGDRLVIHTPKPYTDSLPQLGMPKCMFLKRGKNNTFEITNRSFPWFRVDVRQPYTRSTGRSGVERELIHGLRSKDETVVSDSADWLVRMNSQDGVREILALFDEGSPMLALQAAALQLRVPTGKKEVLQKAMDLIAKTAKEKEMTQLRWDVVWSFSKIGKTDDVAFLNHLLITAPPDVAKALCFSVQAWSNKTTIQFLMETMKKIDEDGKYRCVLCLGELTGQASPSYREFMSNPGKYASEWETWFAAQSGH